MGDSPVVLSLFRPPADLAGTASVGPVEYRPSAAVVAGHWLRWLLRRPVPTVANLARAVRAGSRTMLTGALWAGWVASRFADARVRVVHAHFGYEPACTAVPAAALLRRPVTFTLHARDIYLRNRGLDRRAARAARVVTVCRYNVREILTRFPSIPPDKIELVYCGVDVDRLGPAPASPERDRPVVVSVGRLVPKKGFDTLVGAVAQLRDRGRTVDCRIVGAGPEEGALRAQAAELDVADLVTFTGPLDPDGVAAVVGTADLFVLACRVAPDGDRDSMPVVVKEAMALAVPVVSTDTVGVPEMVDDEVGRLVPPDDPTALADAIGGLLSLPPAGRRALGAAGRERVRQRFDLHAETERLQALFHDVAAAP